MATMTRLSLTLDPMGTLTQDKISHSLWPGELKKMGHIFKIKQNYTFFMQQKQ
jgi:hypothetical protein